MHWRKDTNIERIDSRDAVIILRETANLVPDEFTKDSLDDLLRAALTFGVSALDRYVHERVIKGFVSALRAGDLTKQQEDFSIPVTLALRMVEETRKAYRNGETVRPANEIRKYAQEFLHRQPFQNWREINKAFQLIGENNLSGKLQTAYGVGNMQPIKEELNRIARRRNHIVHEGDLARHQRGGEVKAQQIEKRFVSDSLDFLDDFVGKLDAI
jgi:hypothetical protein